MFEVLPGRSNVVGIVKGAGGGRSVPAACLSQLPPRTSVILVSDFLVADGMHHDLARLQALGGEVHALQVLADDECPPPPAGATLYDIESGATLQPAEATAARSAALAAASRQGDALARFCQRRGIVHSRSRSGAGWRAALTRHLTGLAPGHA